MRLNKNKNISNTNGIERGNCPSAEQLHRSVMMLEIHSMMMYEGQCSHFRFLVREGTALLELLADIDKTLLIGGICTPFTL